MVSKLTTKGLRHIKMRENAIWEKYQTEYINILYIIEKLNPSDMFKKEEKSSQHFQETIFRRDNKIFF